MQFILLSLKLQISFLHEFITAFVHHQIVMLLIMLNCATLKPHLHTCILLNKICRCRWVPLIDPRVVYFWRRLIFVELIKHGVQDFELVLVANIAYVIFVLVDSLYEIGKLLAFLCYFYFIFGWHLDSLWVFLKEVGETCFLNFFFIWDTVCICILSSERLVYISEACI